MAPLSRYCPLCRRTVGEEVCLEHGVPTVPDAVRRVHESAMPLPGTVINGRYRLDKVLGEGGMGRVYAAEQLSMKRPVAIKTLRAHLTADDKQLGRFYREARAISQLTGPHVVRVYDFGVDEATGSPFIAMERVEGAPLTEVAPNGAPLAPLRAARIAAQVARTLVEAGRSGIVHRDLKFENIMLAREVDGRDFVKVLDFGIAKLLSPDETESLTDSGAVIGTPRTMAPEQILGEAVDHRTDLYALGCVLHRLLTGAAPFVGVSRIDVVSAHLTSPVPELDASLAVPGALDELRASLLQKAREDRPQAAEEVLRTLEAIAGGATGAVDLAHGETVDRAGILPLDDETHEAGPAGGVAPRTTRARWPLLVAAAAAPAVIAAALAWPAVEELGPLALPQRVERTDAPAEEVEPDPPLAVPSRMAAIAVRRDRSRLEPPSSVAPVPAAPQEYVLDARPRAVVWSAGAQVGRTPYRLVLEPGQDPAELQLRAPGHQRQTVTIRFGQSQVPLVRLKRVRRQGGATGGNGKGDRPW